MKINRKYQSKGLVLFLFLLVGYVSRAQYMEFEWSDEYRYTNRKTGFFAGFLGTNLTNIYLLQSNIAATHPYENTRLMLVALSKNTMAEIGTLPLRGFPENEGQEEAFKSLDYLTSVVTEDKIYVFWRKLINTDSTRTEEVYAQTYKADLKTDLPLKKVFESVQSVDVEQSFFDPTMCVILFNKERSEIVLGTENYSNGKIEFQYAVMNSQLSASRKKAVELPQRSKELPGKLTSKYELGEDGKLYVRSTVFYTKEELWDLGPKHAKSFPVLTVINSENDDVQQLELRGQDKTITDFAFQIIGDQTRVLGFFGDLSRDTTGIDKQGIFYADLGSGTENSSEINYVYFEKTTLNRLFPKSRGRRKNSDQPSLEEQLQTRFDIEDISIMPDSSLVLFFTRKYNYTDAWSRSGMNGENIYSYENSCEKNNVSAIRFTHEGKILWTGNLERSITYTGTDVADVRVVNKYNKFFVLYGNELAEMKPPKKGKKFQHLTSELEYATFDPNTGRAKKFTTPVNLDDTEPKDLKYLDPNSAIVFDDQFYFHKLKVNQNPLWTAANVICFPTIYYSVNTGNTKLGKADFTMMRIMDGKRPRRKK